MAPNPPVPAATQPEGDGPPQFGLVHAVKVSNDGIVYVADRTNNRVQTFTTAGKYLRQVSLAAKATSDRSRPTSRSRLTRSSSISTSWIQGR